MSFHLQHGKPSPDLGFDGDEALDVDNKILYGPKALGSWGSGSPIGGGTGGGSFLSNHTARVDPSGNDSTGTIGDLTKPFLTVQAAITAFEAIRLGGTDYVIDVGNNFLSEDVTTALHSVSFKGASSDRSIPFNSLTFTDTTHPLSIEFYSCQPGNVSAATTALFFVSLENSGCQSFTNSAGALWIESEEGLSYLADVTAGGIIHLFGLTQIGTVSAPGFNIYVSACLPEYTDQVTGDYVAAPTINSAGSEVFATRSLIQAVTAAGTLHLKDSRVIGANNATSTVYADVLLNPNQFDWSSIPTSDPHVVGRPWRNSGVITISAG